ncbi:sensor histidine kinase [Longimicrobium sp.]|uniref:sensor histidine kinase n=1 Tax=Longimicrobium sp. TaxID=2029185 RepID=UPI002E3166FD|nr:histidine kinase [Longimicrobium sp.]HEX6040816.1 histidine kinase [Longimicrobium sp.]
MSESALQRPPVDAPDPLPPDFRPGAELIRLCPWKMSFILLGIALGLGLTDFLLQATVHPGERMPLAFLAAITFPQYVVLVPFVPAVLFLADRFPMGPGRWRRSLPAHALASLAFVFVYGAAAVAVCDYLLAPLTMPTEQLPRGYNDYVFGLRRVVAVYGVLWIGLYWLIVGAHHTLFYLRRALQRDHEAADLALRALRLEAGLAQANLHALNMQLQPHFLFNTLNAISVLAAKGERVETVRMIGRLGELLRMSLGNTAQTVSLSRELEFAQRYLDIEQVRFHDRMAVRFDVAPDTLGAQVPSMILQPLVENAVKHGLSRKRGAGRIEVRSRRAVHTLELSVRDDGPGFGGAPAGGRTGVGLVNTRARLEQLYGADGFELYRGDAPGGGALVRITLPLRVGSADEDAPAVPVIALEAV